MSNILNELKAQELLKGLDDSEIAKIVPVVSNIKVAKDDDLFRQGEPCKGIYMIKSGKV